MRKRTPPPTKTNVSSGAMIFFDYYVIRRHHERVGESVLRVPVLHQRDRRTIKYPPPQPTRKNMRMQDQNAVRLPPHQTKGTF